MSLALTEPVRGTAAAAARPGAGVVVGAVPVTVPMLVYSPATGTWCCGG